MIWLDWGDSGGKVGDNREASVLNARLFHGDGLAGRSHPNDVGTELTEENDLLWRFVPRAVTGEIHRFGMNVDPNCQPVVHKLVPHLGRKRIIEAGMHDGRVMDGRVSKGEIEKVGASDECSWAPLLMERADRRARKAVLHT